MDRPAAIPLAQRTLEELAAGNPHAASVLDRFGLDYRAAGRQSLEAAARGRGLSPESVVAALQPARVETADPAADDLERVVHDILDIHHTYIRDIGPVITHWLDDTVVAERAQHPELVEVRRVFQTLTEELDAHLAKEEHILFPFILDLVAAARSGTRPSGGPFGTLLNPIRVMEAEHFEATAHVEQLRSLTHDYRVPSDASEVCRRCYEELARFDENLQRHISLENDVLFPGAMALEGRLH